VVATGFLCTEPNPVDFYFATGCATCGCVIFEVAKDCFFFRKNAKESRVSFSSTTWKIVGACETAVKHGCVTIQLQYAWINWIECVEWCE